MRRAARPFRRPHNRRQREAAERSPLPRRPGRSPCSRPLALIPY